MTKKYMQEEKEKMKVCFKNFETYCDKGLISYQTSNDLFRLFARLPIDAINRKFDEYLGRYCYYHLDIEVSVGGMLWCYIEHPDFKIELGDRITTEDFRQMELKTSNFKSFDELPKELDKVKTALKRAIKELEKELGIKIEEVELRKLAKILIKGDKNAK